MKKITLFLTCFLITNILSAQTTLDVPAVGVASRITLSGFTANWTAVANATSYSINVYDGTNTLVSGSPKTITGATAGSLAITGILSPNTSYTYTVTAIGDGVNYASSTPSANSASFTTASSTGSFTLQYAESDVAALNGDLKGGAADIYELTTSGGAYTFSTGSTSNNNTLIRNTTVKAAAGLAARPILKLNSATTGSTANIFNTTTAGLTVRFEGLEFDGVNAGGTGQPLAFYDQNTGASNIKLYISNCFFRSCKNGSGNGAIRLNGVGTTQAIDIQNSVFNDCGGRIIYINNATSAKCDVTIKNTTFSNNTNISSRASVIYNNSVNTGTTSFDHCTFYNIVSNGTDQIVRAPSGSGAITVSNTIFYTVANTLTGTFSWCYLAGFSGTVPTGTNTFATVPLFTNAATLDFSLSNKSSFICADTKIAGNTIYYSTLPKLDPPQVGTAGNIGTNSFTATWSTVANALGGYSIKVYEGATLANTTLAPGQATTSAAISGLKTGTTYTYTVTAIGDATSYDSSDASAASAAFTTLGLPAPAIGTPTNISADGFTANWTPVANAVSYNVMLYLTTNLISTTNVTGQASSGLTFSNLAMGTTYTYKVMAVGDGATYLNSDASASSAIAKTTALTINRLNPDFSDGTWGAVISGSLALGTFPTFSANGFDLTKAYIQSTNITGLKGETFTHMLKLDKTSNSGVLDLPVISSVAQLEIHASATTGRQFTLSVWNAGTSAWDLYGTYATTVDTENIFLINFPVALTNAKFRIINISPGAFSFYQLKSHTTQPVALSTPSIGAATNIGIKGFTANWTSGDAHATGYRIFVYKGTSLVKSVDVAGQSVNSTEITGLQADSVYTCKVSALGDGDVLYSNSLLSAASPVVTLLSDIGTVTSDIRSQNFFTVTNRTVYTAGVGKIEVFNLQGSKLTEINETNRVTLDGAGGLYIVRFRSANATDKILKISIR